jgi:hypothetical protein
VDEITVSKFGEGSFTDHLRAPRTLEQMQAPSLPAGTGFLANRLLVAASLSGVLAGFLFVADPMTKAGFSSQVDIGAAVAAALGTSIVFQANFRRRVVRLVA